MLVTNTGAYNSTRWGWHFWVQNKYRPVKKEVCTSEGGWEEQAALGS